MKLLLLIAMLIGVLFVQLAHASHDNYEWNGGENAFIVCSYDLVGSGHNCDKTNYFKSREACADRMKKAMLDIDGYIQGRDGLMIYRHQGGEAKLEHFPNWKPDDALKLRWDQVIRECAK